MGQLDSREISYIFRIVKKVKHDYARFLSGAVYGIMQFELHLFKDEKR